MFFAGIDAHSRYVVLVVIDNSGTRVLGPTRVKLEESARLLALLADYRPLEAIVETSSAWPWLDELMSPAGIQFVLAHAKRLRAIAEANYKRDDIDAELLARMRLAGLIPVVYPTPYAQREWATLIRHRTALVRHRTALANRLHGQLHVHGQTLPRGHLLTRTGRRTLRTTLKPQLTPEQWRVARTHLRLIESLSTLVRALDRRIALVAREIPEARLLQTVPGIGPHRALLLCAEVLPITRFRTAGHLTSYAGLAPRSRQSGTRPIRHGSIPAGANRWLRGALVRAVVSHVRHAPESWLSRYYLQQKQRLGWPTARVAAARKLARAVHAMLSRQTVWQNESPRGELQERHAAQTA